MKATSEEKSRSKGREVPQAVFPLLRPSQPPEPESLSWRRILSRLSELKLGSQELFEDRETKINETSCRWPLCRQLRLLASGLQSPTCATWEARSLSSRFPASTCSTDRCRRLKVHPDLLRPHQGSSPRRRLKMKTSEIRRNANVCSAETIFTDWISARNSSPEEFTTGRNRSNSSEFAKFASSRDISRIVAIWSIKPAATTDADFRIIPCFIVEGSGLIVDIVKIGFCTKNQREDTGRVPAESAEVENTGLKTVPTGHSPELIDLSLPSIADSAASAF